MINIKAFYKKNIRQRISAGLVCVQLAALALGVSGCGAANIEIPELKEPKSATVSYRPATKRIVGKTEYLNGVVVPTDYPCFSEKGTFLKELYVGVGDYVEEGDVVAASYTGDTYENITRIEAEIQLLVNQKECEQTVSDEKIEKLGYEKKIEQFLKNKKGVSAKETEIEAEQENIRYKTALIDSQILSKRSEIEDLEKNIQEEVYVAPHSGYVTNVIDVNQGNAVLSNQNIVVISDYDELYIEVGDLRLDKYLFENYKGKWMYYDGKRVEITEHKYTNTEMSYALSVDRNPPMAFDVKGVDLKCGSNVVLYFMKNTAEPRLAIGNDSIIRESDEEYIYVKGEGDTNERRPVELGETDGLYTEVKSGVEEGELVRYNNNAVPPTKQEEYEVTCTDFSETGSSEFVDFAYPYYDIFISDCDGKFQKIHDMGTATTGDSLFAVESLVESADTESARLDIANLDNERAKAEKEYEKQKKELTKQVNAKDKFNKKTMASNTDAVYKYMYSSDRAKCDLDILEAEESLSEARYNHDRYYAQLNYDKLLKGTGSIGEYSDYLVEAPEAGRISAVVHPNLEKLRKGSFVMTLEKRFKEPDEKNEHERLFVLVSTTGKGAIKDNVNGTAKLGAEVTLKKENDKHEIKTWKGKCIGINGDKNRYCLFTRDDKTYSTFSAPFTKNVQYQFCIEMEDDITEADIKEAEMEFYGTEMHKVVTVPSVAVKVETNQLSADNSDDKYYVWKIEDGEIVKEYVEIYPSSSATGSTYILNGIEPGDKVLK